MLHIRCRGEAEGRKSKEIFSKEKPEISLILDIDLKKSIKLKIDNRYGAK